MKTMMKNSNLMTRVALTLLVMMLTATTAWADDSGSCGDNVTYYYSESTHTLTISGSGAMEDYSTTPWGSYCEDIKAVVIENGVTKIGNLAFFKCSSLKSFSIPNSVTSIGNFAFVYCSSLKYVAVNAETPPTLGSRAFDYNADGRKICVPNSSVDTYKERWGSYANDIVDVSFLFLQDGDTYTIHSATGWDLFCNEVEGGKSFSGKTIVLDDDIVVTRMAGSIAKDFRGTFNGGGHRLTLHYGSVENPVDAQFVAPFPAVAGGAKFIDLTIDGYIHAGYKGSDEPGVGGLIGHLFGNVTVEHCVSNVVINSDKDRVGGFVGLCDHAVVFTDCKSSSVITCTGSSSGFVGWSRSSAFTIAFEGCLFDGKLLKKDGVGEGNGGFVGWKGNTKTVNINNCLVALDDVKAMATYHSSTFARNNNYPPNITNSYYTTAFGTAQGTQVHSIKAGEGVNVALAGNVINEYETSGITFYDTGIMCDGKLYAVKDDVVTLTLSHDSSIDDLFLGYEAKDSLQNAVTLTPAGDNYTLTMPDDNVTVTAKVEMLYSLTLPDGMEVENATPAAIDGKYKEGTSIQFKIKSEDYVLEGDVMNGDDVLTAANGIYTVTVGNADITITATVKKAVEPNVILSDDFYTAKDGDVLTGSTDGTVTIEHGASITLSDVTINGGIVCEGTATIILVGENSVTGQFDNAGIQVGGEGTTLTIKGNGSLAANGGYRGAGIGTGYVYDGSVTSGDIIIEGGSITANGGDGGAGIGTGQVYDGTVTFGDITIKCGSITANGGWDGAGIGMGGVYNGTATFGDITIMVGSIAATGGEEGAGIGMGGVYKGTVTLSTLTIYDDIDRVDATGNRKSGISEDVVYMHGETNVTEDKSEYFDITQANNQDVIKAIKYSIIIAQEDKHGTVTVDTWRAKCDESVAITVTPDNGYMLETIEVKDANGNEVSRNDMSFTMPDSDVTITVTWKYVGVKGDVNGNGTVDISDVVALVNAILNDESNDAYDISGDKLVNINDVVALVNLILNN